MAEQQVIEKPQEPPKQDQPQPEPRPNPQPAPAVGNVSGVVQQLKQERERAQKDVKSLDAAIAALGSLGSNSQPPQENSQSAPAAVNPPQPTSLPAATKAQTPPPQPQAKPPAAPVAAKPPRSMARRLLVPLVVILVLAAVGFGVWKVFFSAPPIPANIVQLSGRIEGDDSAVSPKASGRILEIRVREGDSVSTGDIIAVLDDCLLYTSRCV